MIRSKNFTNVTAIITVLIIVLSSAQTAFANGAPPPNDNFANATVISSLPFDDTVDNTSATTETGEPGANIQFLLFKTVWYSFTPTETQYISVSATSSFFTPTVLIYSGTSLDSLTCYNCETNQLAAFQVVANTTYYFQIGSKGNPLDQTIPSGLIQFHVELTPID